MSTRPACIAHWGAIQQPDDARYPGSDELLSIGSPLGRATGLTRIGVHHELLPPGRRTSFPHAERDEDEGVFVLEGHPHAWIDGELHALRPGDFVGFAAGTGVAHTILNDSDRPVRLLVVGEASHPSHRVHYPLHPGRNAAIGEAHWHDAPARRLGPHDGLPRPVPTATVSTLETPRLVLRPHRVEDAEGIFAMRTHELGVRFLSGLPPRSVDAVRERLHHIIAQNGSSNLHGWTLTRRDDGGFVGLAGIVRIDPTHACGELAYEQHHASWGQGLMREAIARVVEHGFDDLGLHRLEIRTDPANARSIRLAQALGFSLEGHLRQNERHPDGRWLDTLIFGRCAG